MVLRFEPGRIFRAHVTLIIVLGAAHLGVWVAQVLGHPYLRGVGPMFNMNRENNAPALVSGLALTIGAVLLLETARRERLEFPTGASAAKGWASLSAAFLFLAFDEVMSLHEAVRGWLPASLMASGRWHYAWVGPYLLGTLLLGGLLFRFWYGLPEPTRVRLAVAGAVYVGGAVGLEVLAGFLGQAYGRTSMVYGMEVWLEESMEMLGVALLIRAVLAHNSAAEVARSGSTHAAGGMTFSLRAGVDRRRPAHDRRGSTNPSRS